MLIHGPPDHLYLSYFQAYTDHRGAGHHTDWRDLPYSLIEYSRDGRWHIEVLDGTYETKPGEPFFIPAGTKHKLRIGDNVADMQTVWCFFRVERLPGRDMFRDLIAGPRLPESVHLPCQDLLNEALKNQKSESPFNTVIQHRIAFSLIELLYPVCEQRIPQKPTVATRLQPIFDFIEENYHRDFSMKELAKAATLSQSRLQSVFREEVGMPPWTYVIERRISAAQELLHKTDMRIDEIAFRTGFKSQFYFSRLFVKQTGVSPSAFRKSLRGAPKRKR